MNVLFVLSILSIFIGVWTIIRYLAHEEYSISDVKAILDFLEIDYTTADIENLNNHQYLIENIIFADLRQYHEGKYDDLLKLYASYNRNVMEG